MRLFARFTYAFLLTGTLLFLDGLFYARTASDVMLILLIFVAITDVLAGIVFRSRFLKRRLSIEETPLVHAEI